MIMDCLHWYYVKRFVNKYYTTELSVNLTLVIVVALVIKFISLSYDFYLMSSLTMEEYEGKNSSSTYKLIAIELIFISW